MHSFTLGSLLYLILFNFSIRVTMVKVRKVGSRGTKSYVKDEGAQNWDDIVAFTCYLTERVDF